jgi:16S rRNA processing protein RimM
VAAFLFLGHTIPMEHSHPDHFLLGTIVRTHGVRGDVLALLDTDTPNRYKSMKEVFVESAGVLKHYAVSKVSINAGQSTATLHLTGIEDMNAAETLLKHKLYLPLSSLPKLRGKKFYFHEVIGYTVVDAIKGTLGPITTVYERSDQPVIECDLQGKSILFPVHDDLIRKIDREEKQFHVQLPEGLIDIYLED